MVGPSTRRGWVRRGAAFVAAIFLRPGTGTAENRPLFPRGREGRLRWLAFYGQLGNEAALAAQDLVVLDPAFAGDLPQVLAGGGRVCAYISLGEIRRGDELFARLDPACLLEENAAWPGTWRVDVRHPAWTEFILREKLPAIRARGFAGLMLDTLDTPPWLELVDPVAYRGMREAAIGLVRAIRRACPDLVVIVNRGYAILPELCPMIDAVLAESLLTSPSGATGFRWNSTAEVEVQLALLAPARTASPPIPILTLDYWDPADTLQVRQIYARQRALGHQPYVATVSLGEIVAEPAA